ncbi:MAG: SCP2 sterol-binding domain-containing protein [Aeromicrobium sp.]
MTETPVFGTPEFFAALKARLDADELWRGRAAGLTCNMVYLYGAPMNRGMSVRFDDGHLVEFDAIDPDSPPAADFVISANGQVWRSIIQQELKPTLAMATGKLKVKGKQTFLLKHMAAFGRLMELQTTMDVSYAGE